MQIAPRCAGIPALRLVACLIIMGSHVGYSPLRNAGAPPFILNVLELRSVCTSLFFALSGFVITQSLIKRRQNLGRFMIRRTVRLWPIHFAALLMAAPATVFGSVDYKTAYLVTGFLLSATMTQGLSMAHAMMFNAPAWAVTAFMLGYVGSWLLVRYEPAKRSVFYTLLITTWLIAVVPTVLMVISVGPEYRYTLSKPAGNEVVITAETVVHMAPPIRLAEIVFGGLLALLNTRVLTRAAAKRIGSDFIVLSLAAIYGTIVFLSGDDSRLRFLLGHGLLLPASGLLILALWNNSGLVHRIAAQSLLRKLGDSSTTIYFAHLPFFAGARLVMTHMMGMSKEQARGDIGLFLATTALFLAICYVVQPRYDRCCDLLEAKIFTFRSRAKSDKCCACEDGIPHYGMALQSATNGIPTGTEKAYSRSPASQEPLPL